ncbi:MULTISPECIES: RyR domain-containing protein [unclassified Streptomyces]|uniref:RyR domain-containing protein n=1 Tax=unclassified Streptomyces TaxID=2593676 RepID=UPI00224E32A7|nr:MULTISPECIES: RyR domain-containing protein [unclassified Streptomyces]MCX5337229.1 RyR domain-containing protein [Streptomyces sp. NBC_00140]MCX5365820.1 RyR domain-containing protein [Streptomyces sp. NBC_00124]
MRRRARRQQWTPPPTGTVDVKLPDGLHALIEFLAEEAHNNWARQRLSEGWRYGRRHSRRRKTHPLLVPYSELTYEQQEADRVVALGTLKAIVGRGYTLQEPAGR